ncbi:MAG: hypothetical protein JRJ47_05990 [Deltaproteobacteria bacterium]|nr:hypothetical protein [Deltaproteobacteria bacterium]
MTFKEKKEVLKQIYERFEQDASEFKKLSLSGGFDPGKIAEFGKSHSLVINRSAR